MSCPICGREAERKYRPFCSKRCADIDLGRWMTGAYAIPGDDPDEAPSDVHPAGEDDVRH